VVLVFDTGQHRHLTLSQADGYTATMQWGRPQAETVKAYRLEMRVDGGWIEMAREESNHQRHRTHAFVKPVRTDALRVTVLSTHGIDHARIFEVRAYG
jgi:hypothetical protein